MWWCIPTSPVPPVPQSIGATRCTDPNRWFGGWVAILCGVPQITAATVNRHTPTTADDFAASAAGPVRRAVRTRPAVPVPVTSNGVPMTVPVAIAPVLASAVHNTASMPHDAVKLLQRAVDAKRINLEQAFLLCNVTRQVLGDESFAEVLVELLQGEKP